MGQVHNELRRGPFSGALKVILGDTHNEGGIERYGETLQPMVDLWGRSEWARRLNRRLFAGSVGTGPTAGEQSMHAIVNPAVSPDLIVLEQLGILVGAATTVRITPTVLLTDITATLAISLATQARDNRWWRDPLTVGYQTLAQIFSGSNAGTLGGITTEQVIGLTTGFSEARTLPYIIRPGTALLIENLTVNISLTVNVSGVVYTGQPGELV
jgi:hypothetical protein